jgi:hypothetical protein
LDLFVCTTWKSALDFHAKAIQSAHCPWCDCISLEDKLVHTSKLEANIQKQHVHEACRACMYEKQWVLSQKHWVLKCNLSMPKALGAKIGAFKAMHMEKMLW